MRYVSAEPWRHCCCGHPQSLPAPPRPSPSPPPLPPHPGSLPPPSISYALQNLGARLVLVMGHTKCGAVKAAVAEFVEQARQRAPAQVGGRVGG